MQHKNIKPAAVSAGLLVLLLCAAGCSHNDPAAPASTAASGGAVPPGGPALSPQARSEMENQQRADAAARAATGPKPAKHP